MPSERLDNPRHPQSQEFHDYLASRAEKENKCIDRQTSRIQAVHWAILAQIAEDFLPTRGEALHQRECIVQSGWKGPWVLLHWEWPNPLQEKAGSASARAATSRQDISSWRRLGQQLKPCPVGEAQEENCDAPSCWILQRWDHRLGGTCLRESNQRTSEEYGSSQIDAWSQVTERIGKSQP